jgi:hypothetical protein
MKKIMIVVFVLGLTMTVAAQRGHGTIGRSRVIVVSPGFGFGYSPFYSPWGYGYGYPYGYPYGYSTYRPSKLQREADELKADYDDKIKSAKHDKSISKDERKKIVAQLKTERDQAIHDLKANYYKQKTQPQQPPVIQEPNDKS